MQRITFTAETNAADTHTAWQFAKRGEGNELAHYDYNDFYHMYVCSTHAVAARYSATWCKSLQLFTV